MTVRDLIGNIRKFTKNVINVKDFYKITKWTEEQKAEYIENYDLNQEVISILNKIFQYIKNKREDPSEKGCIDLLGSFGSGKSHILLFLAVLLKRDEYSEEIKEKIDKKLNENPDFYLKYNEIYQSLNTKSENSKLSGTLLIPIRLAEFRKEEFDKILEIAVTRDILKNLDSNETLITDVKKLIKFFETEQKTACRSYIDPSDYNQFERLYDLIKDSQPVNYVEVAKAAKKINKALEDSMGMTTHISTNPLEDICKHPLLGRKYKNIIFLFDELTQWWGTRPNDELLDNLQTISGKIDDIATDLLKDDEGNEIENNNVIAIFAHQREIFIGSKGPTVKNRFEFAPDITSEYINSIIVKRFFYKDLMNPSEIRRVAEKIYDKLESLGIPQEVL